MNRASLVLLASLLASCTNPGERAATVPVTAHGTATAPFVEGAYTITLTRADVAFGPAYFCATDQASTESCATAVLETTVASAFDALDPSSQPLESLLGFEGTVRTVQYDMGIPFSLASTAPTPLAGAVEGHSAILEGTASDGLSTFSFTFALDVASTEAGATAVIGLPSEADVTRGETALALGVDPRAWLAGVDWAAVAAIPHAPGQSVLVPVGSTEYQRVLDAVAVTAPPTFTWSLAVAP